MKKGNVLLAGMTVSSAVSLLAACLMFLAMHDIAQGTEPDLSGEWVVMDYTWLVIMVTALVSAGCGILGLKKKV